MSRRKKKWTEEKKVDEETGLPVEWNMVQDQVTRHYYYYNITTNDYHPYLPAEVVESIPLPDDWEIGFDPKSRRMYFVDLTAKSTQWKYPADKLPKKTLITLPPALPPPMSPPPRSSPLAVFPVAEQSTTSFTVIPIPAEVSRMEIPSEPGYSCGDDLAEYDDLISGCADDFSDNVAMAEEEEEEEEEVSTCEYLCIGCKKCEMDSVFVPCAHMCMCMNCAKKTKNCPLCNNEIEGLNRFYKC